MGKRDEHPGDGTRFPTGEPAGLDDDVLRSAIEFKKRADTDPPPNLPPLPPPPGPPDHSGGDRFPTSEPTGLDADDLNALDKFARSLPPATDASEAPPPAVPPDIDPLRDNPPATPPTEHIDLSPGQAQPDPDGVQFSPPATDNDMPITLPGGGETTVHVPGTVGIAVPGGAGHAERVREIFEEGARRAERRQQNALPFGWNVWLILAGLGALIAIVAFALFGGGSAPGASPSPAGPGSSAGLTTPAGSGGVASQEASSPGPSEAVQGSPAATVGGPPPGVLIATNLFSLTPADAVFCRDGGTITVIYKIAGIAPNTPVEVTVTGPGTNQQLSLVASPDVAVQKSFTFPPGGGKWTSTVNQIGGNQPPSSGSFEATSVDPC